jgi:hypothetical protein
MGSMTDAEIAAWQRHAGITPASGEQAKLLEALSQAAFTLIKIIELERSGIRDGDGRWHGSDVMGHVVGDIGTLGVALDRLHFDARDAKEAEGAGCTVEELRAKRVEDQKGWRPWRS